MPLSLASLTLVEMCGGFFNACGYSYARVLVSISENRARRQGFDVSMGTHHCLRKKLVLMISILEIDMESLVPMAHVQYQCALNAGNCLVVVMRSIAAENALWNVCSSVCVHLHVSDESTISPTAPAAYCMASTNQMVSC